MLDVDYDVDFTQTWQCLEKAYNEGKVKAIGISNFNIKQLQRLLDNCKIRPHVHQIECHIYFQNKEVVEFCRKNAIQITAFAPLATPRKCPTDYLLAQNKKVKVLSAKYAKSWAQISNKFLIQQAIIPICSAENEKQLIENLNCNTFELNENDMNDLKRLDKNRRIYIFDYAPG